VKLVPKKSLINLIPFNPTSAPFKRPSQDVVLAFKSEIRKHGFICYVREPRGVDIDGACGMLAGKEK
jgi:23S rRNA (adenine2503-C2)-methyltransferase